MSWAGRAGGGAGTVCACTLRPACLLCREVAPQLLRSGAASLQPLRPSPGPRPCRQPQPQPRCYQLGRGPYTVLMYDNQAATRHPIQCSATTFEAVEEAVRAPPVLHSSCLAALLSRNTPPVLAYHL